MEPVTFRQTCYATLTSTAVYLSAKYALVGIRRLALLSKLGGVYGGVPRALLKEGIVWPLRMAKGGSSIAMAIFATAAVVVGCWNIAKKLSHSCKSE